MRETGENPAKYGWYLDLARRGIPGQLRLRSSAWSASPATSPDGSAAWQASAYPKLPGVVSA